MIPVPVPDNSAPSGGRAGPRLVALGRRSPASGNNECYPCGILQASRTTDNQADSLTTITVHATHHPGFPHPASPHHSAALLAAWGGGHLYRSIRVGERHEGGEQGKHISDIFCQQRTLVDHESLFVGEKEAGHSGAHGGSTADLGTRCNGSGHPFHFRTDGDPKCPVVSSAPVALNRLVRLSLLSMVYGQASLRVSATAALGLPSHGCARAVSCPVGGTDTGTVAQPSSPFLPEP